MISAPTSSRRQRPKSGRALYSRGPSARLSVTRAGHRIHSSSGSILRSQRATTCSACASVWWATTVLFLVPRRNHRARPRSSQPPALTATAQIGICTSSRGIWHFQTHHTKTTETALSMISITRSRKPAPASPRRHRHLLQKSDQHRCPQPIRCRRRKCALILKMHCYL